MSQVQRTDMVATYLGQDEATLCRPVQAIKEWQ